MPPADMAPSAAAEETAEPRVLVTILKDDAAGTYIIEAGDEPEEDVAMGAGVEPVPVAPTGKTVDSLGAALNEARLIMEADMESSGAEPMGEAAFEAGYAEEPEMMPG